MKIPEKNIYKSVKYVPYFRNDEADKVSISTDPGRYLCDFVFYKSLHSSKGRSLFIHVPPLNKPFSEDELAKIIYDVLQCILSQIKNWYFLLK